MARRYSGSFNNIEVVCRQLLCIKQGNTITVTHKIYKDKGMYDLQVLKINLDTNDVLEDLLYFNDLSKALKRAYDSVLNEVIEYAELHAC